MSMKRVSSAAVGTVRVVGSVQRGRLAGALVMGALGLALAAPASSTAVTFGANLSRPVSQANSCDQISATALFPPGQTYGSCSLNFQNLTTGETVFPPAGRGFVNTVRVKVGPITGPMQIVVEQALRKDNPSDPGHPTYACCQAVGASQVFTPAANTTTSVRVNLPVRQDIAPDPKTGIYTDRHLALSVLAGNVPVPAAFTSPAETAVFGVWFPAWRVGDERLGPPPSGTGAVILFNADWAKCPATKKSAAHSAKKKKKKKKCGKKKRKKTKRKSAAAAQAAVLRGLHGSPRTASLD